MEKLFKSCNFIQALQVYLIGPLMRMRTSVSITALTAYTFKNQFLVFVFFFFF